MPVPPASPPLRDRGESRLGRPPPAGPAAGPRAHVLPAPAAAAPAPGVRVSIPALRGFPRLPAPLGARPSPAASPLRPLPAPPARSRVPFPFHRTLRTPFCSRLSALPFLSRIPFPCPGPSRISPLLRTLSAPFSHPLAPLLPPRTLSRPSHSAAFPSHHPAEFHFPAPAFPRGAPELSAAPFYPGAEEWGFGAGGAIPRLRERESAGRGLAAPGVRSGAAAPRLGRVLPLYPSRSRPPVEGTVSPKRRDPLCRRRLVALQDAGGSFHGRCLRRDGGGPCPAPSFCPRGSGSGRLEGVPADGLCLPGAERVLLCVSGLSQRYGRDFSFSRCFKSKQKFCVVLHMLHFTYRHRLCIPSWCKGSFNFIACTLIEFTDWRLITLRKKKSPCK